MEWADDAIVLAARRHGETSLLVHLLTRAHGRHAGLVRGGQGKRTRPVYEVGNRVTARWRARLAEHLGTFTCELLRGDAALLIDDPLRLACLSSTAAIAEAALPERESMPRLFEGFLELLEALTADRSWRILYVGWELALLTDLGFGLDLGRCVVTGTSEDLAFVSPKSGSAVSATAGEPYRDKLLRLPPFLLESDAERSFATTGDLLDGLALTGFFLERHVFASGSGEPPARRRFVDRLAQSATISGVQSTG